MSEIESFQRVRPCLSHGAKGPWASQPLLGMTLLLTCSLEQTLGQSAAASGDPQVVATCVIIPQEPHWVSSEALAFFSEFYLLISLWVTALPTCSLLLPG